jgi:predicted MPP superfamily phosphohydrolase
MLLLLFVGACLGHLALSIASHNWWYGQRMPKQLGPVNHLGHGLLALAFPLWLLWAWGVWLDGLFAFSPDFAWPPSTQECVAAYVVLCAVVGFVGLPLDIARRLLRRDPAASRSEVLDGVKHLGYRPEGRGHFPFLTRLPGNEVFQLEMVERTIRLPRLPLAWDGLTVLHVSDLHLHGTPDRTWYRWVMDQCAAWEPDLVAVTGDIADSYWHQRWVVPVLGRLRWRLAAFAILGNHDHWYDAPYIRRRLRRLGMRVLANTWEPFEVRGEAVAMIGHEGPWLRPAPDLSACPPEMFRLCLSHTPDNIRWARRNHIDLMLSGHVHGGQVRVPVFGSVLVPSRYGRRYDCGTFAEGPTLLHVTRGLGGQEPVRYGCKPEVVKLTLRRA